MSGYAEVLIDLSECKLHMENVELTLSLMNFDCNYFALYELELTLLDITILHCTTDKALYSLNSIALLTCLYHPIPN